MKGIFLDISVEWVFRKITTFDITTYSLERAVYDRYWTFTGGGVL